MVKVEIPVLIKGSNEPRRSQLYKVNTKTSPLFGRLVQHSEHHELLHDIGSVSASSGSFAWQPWSSPGHYQRHY